MVALTERRYRRAEQLAVLVYPLVILAVLGLSLGVSSDQPMGGSFFVLFSIWFGIAPAAFATGLLVLVVNGLYAVRGGDLDRLNTVLAGFMVVFVPPVMYPVYYGTDILPDILFVFVAPVAFVVGPLAMLVHAFRLPTRLEAAVSGPTGGAGHGPDS